MMRVLPPRPPVARALAEMAPDRDRLIDAVRAFAIVIVVLGHGFLAIVAWRNGVPRAGNVLANYPTAQLITWVFQVMPLFFFAGGYANASSWEHRGEKRYTEWMSGRARRLLRPLWGYLAVMVPVALVLGIALPVKISSPILVIATQLLWFLGIYLVVTALTPVLVRMEVRYEGVLIVGALASIALIDFARFHDFNGPWALLNFVFVWSLLASLGMRYRRGLLTPRAGFLLGFSALIINIVMVLVNEWYPRSMVGMPGDRISNVAPPTLALTMHGIVVIGVVAALANPIRKWMNRAAVWRKVVLINIVMMTIYLWHLPMLMVLFLIERAIGFERPATVVTGIGPVPIEGFWWASPGHWIAFVLLVIFAVWILWPLEYLHGEYLQLSIWNRTRAINAKASPSMVAVGSAIVGVALLMLSAVGLNLIPMRTISYSGVPINSLIALGLLGAGAALIRRGGAAT